MDVVTPERRSAIMSKISGSNTRPELRVRRTAHRLGLRFRIHRRDLPGTPDLIFPARRKAVFVHGCFWHSHSGCKYAYKPKSNVAFWQDKLQKNIDRDIRAARDLKALGWDVIVIWECETTNDDRLVGILNGRVSDASG